MTTFESLLFIITMVFLFARVKSLESIYSLLMFEDQLLPSPLSNKHLTVAAKETTIDLIVTRNSTGHIITFDGVAWMMLEYLSAAHVNTSFSIIPYPPMTQIDGSADKPGLIDLLRNGEFDIVTASTPTSSRSAIVEFTHPLIYLSISFLIPSSSLSVNMLSATKPFQVWVWVSLLLTILIVFATLLLMELAGKNKSKKQYELEMISYVLGVLLYQSVAYRFSKRLAIRMVIATWSLAALLFINYYNSLCTSFLTIPIKKPLIQSVSEIPNHPEIRLLMTKNQNTASLVLSAESGLLKRLGDRIRAYPGSLCPKYSQCVDLVKAGNAVFAEGKDTVLLNGLKRDFEATGKCNMEMGKENFMAYPISWALQKKSPYVDVINKSFMRMMEAGLIQKWHKERLPKVEKCFPTTKMKRDETAEGREPLPLIGFTGAFIIFSIGALVALFVFFMETCIFGRMGIFKSKNIAIIA